jgi:hypothetical protein
MIRIELYFFIIESINVGENEKTIQVEPGRPLLSHLLSHPFWEWPFTTFFIP